MKRIENDCVGCDIPCVDCGLKRNPHWYCDECKCEEDLYLFDDEELCIDCIIKRLEKVSDSE